MSTWTLSPPQAFPQPIGSASSSCNYGAEGRGYFQVQSTRPQTVACGLVDSPAAQLAWIVEKFKEWTNPAAELPEDAVDKDLLLTNASLYWFTRSGAGAAGFMYEAAHSTDWMMPSGTPQGTAVFAADSVTRAMLGPEHKVEHWSEFISGGHFAAMEAPDLLVEDVRAFFGPFR